MGVSFYAILLRPPRSLENFNELVKKDRYLFIYFLPHHKLNPIYFLYIKETLDIQCLQNNVFYLKIP